MPQPLTPAILGAIVRDARLAAGLSQTALGARIGASRFWIAEFEQGKATAELGLALKAVQALGLTVRVTSGAEEAGETRTPATQATPAADVPAVDLGALIAEASGMSKDAPAGPSGRRTRAGSQRGKATAPKAGWPATMPAPPR